MNDLSKFSMTEFPWRHGLRPKDFKLVWRYYQLLSGFLANDHLPRVPRLSANDKGDNDMILGVVHESPGIYLTAEEKLGKISAR